MGKEYNTNDFNSANNKEIIADNGVKITNLFLKSIAESIPFLGPLMSESFELIFEEFQNSKKNELVEIITNNKDNITSDMVSNNEFIINTAKTFEMVKRLSTNDKVKYYANIICNGYFKEGEAVTSDDFDEYISILNDVSYREIIFLTEFAKVARFDKERIVEKDALQDYINTMKKSFPDINSLFVLKRLERTGFVNDISVNANVEGNTLFINTPQNGREDSMKFRLSNEYDSFEKVVLKSM